jgi:phosphotransferase system HPr-like phosphotransfer protein
MITDVLKGRHAFEILQKSRIRIEGADAAEAMREIERLIQSWFDEDQI